MATATPTETDQAIKQLTDQIAQLSINLAQQQQLSSSVASVNYAEASTQAPQLKQPLTCFYYRHTGHFISNCITKKKDRKHRQSSYDRRPNRNSYHDYSDPEVETILTIEVSLMKETSIHLITIKEIEAPNAPDTRLIDLLLYIIMMYIISIRTRHPPFLLLLALKNEKLY